MATTYFVRRLPLIFTQSVVNDTMRIGESFFPFSRGKVRVSCVPCAASEAHFGKKKKLALLQAKMMGTFFAMVAMSRVMALPTV